MFYWKNSAFFRNTFLKLHSLTDWHPLSRTVGRILRHSILVCPCFLIFSCNRKAEDKATFYPIDSLVNHQIRYLAAAKATIRKTATVGDRKDEKTYTPADTTAWLKELGVFLELDAINKPINQHAYLVDDGLTDIRSNLSVKAFTAKESLPVKYLRIYYHQSTDNLRRLEAEFNEENSLYKNSRHLLLEFQEVHNKIVLTSYSIEGGQKMYLDDSVRYAVKGSITLPN
jgi:hypothetical protein